MQSERAESCRDVVQYCWIENSSSFFAPLLFPAADDDDPLFFFFFFGQAMYWIVGDSN